MMQPILTIGIPTYNRSELLNDLLSCIHHQFNKLEDTSLLQLVVSDNNSTDSTRQIVEQHVAVGLPVQYSCNEENIGANNNILKIGYELARGKYCWIIGDDDLIRDGGLAYLLMLLNGKANADVLYLNQTNDRSEDRDEIKNTNSVNAARIMCSQTKDELLPNGMSILAFTTHNALFTSLSSFIFKTDVWKDQFIGYQSVVPFNTLANTFPHSTILSKSLMQQPVYYVGHPYLAFFIGAQDWFSNWELMLATRVVELTDRFEAFGASRVFLKVYRERLFKDIFNAFYRGFSDNNLPAWYHVNFRTYLFKYFRYKNFRKAIWQLAVVLLRIKLKLGTRFKILLHRQ